MVALAGNAPIWSKHLPKNLPSPISDPGKTGGAGDRSLHPRHRLYGRRLGHALRQGQQELIDQRLPRLMAPGDGPIVLAPGPKEWWLEIGFGGGEHLAGQLVAHPDIGMIGAEPFLNGMASLLAKLPDDCDPRLILWDRDARNLLGRIEPASLARVFLLFPDPWPKKRHHKRRFVSPESLAAIHLVLVPGGEFRVATDIADYADWTMIEIMRHGGFDWPAQCADDWRIKPADHVQTRYEAKALKADRKPAYLRFFKS